MCVVSNGADRPSSERQGRDYSADVFDPEDITIRKRLAAAKQASENGLARSRALRTDAARMRRLSMRARVHRATLQRSRQTLRSTHAGPVPRDPLSTTIALARACEQLSRIEFFEAGRRSTAPPVQLVALAASEASATEPHGGPRLRIYATTLGDRHLVRLVGELDLMDADRVRDALVAQAASTVVLDLTDLRFIDAAGVAGILAAYRLMSAAGHWLTVRGAQNMVRRVFEITELGYLLQD